MGEAVALGLKAASFLWKHKTWVIIGLLAVALGITRLELNGARHERDNYKVEATTQKGRADTAEGNLSEAHKALDVANAEVEKRRADEERTNAINVAHAAAQARMLGELKVQIQEWQRRAKEHPEELRPLGPAACDAYRSMYGEAACPSPDHR